MKRIKVINEPSELVPVLRCVDSDLKRKVFLEVSKDWKTLDQVEDEFGVEGREALILFEKMKLVESMWQSGKDNKQDQVNRIASHDIPPYLRIGEYWSALPICLHK